MNGYKINDNLYINCNNVDYVSFLNDKVKIHMNDNTSYYITPEQYKDIETKISQSGGSGGGADITANIKITGNVSDILATTEHNKLCILSNTSELSFKVVDKIEGGSEEISTLSEVLPQILRSACCSIYNDNVYIFGGNGSSGYTNTIYKFNCTSKKISTLSITLPQALENARCSIYGDNIYIFGGYISGGRVKTIYKFNCSNETISTLSTTLPKALELSCCSIYGDNIYIFGGLGSSISSTIYKFNCTNESITTLSVSLPQALYGACCSIYGDNIFIFGGSNSDPLNTIYKFNCTNETIETLSVALPKNLSQSCCSAYENNIYVIGGMSNSLIRVNTIYKFDCITNAIETLNTTLPQALDAACCSIYGDNIFIFGGSNSSDKLNTIYNFSVSFELTANNVLLYCANSDYSFDLITDQVTIPIKNVYIGDSNNTAQLTNAYLYDETQSAWINVNTGEVLS